MFALLRFLFSVIVAVTGINDKHENASNTTDSRIVLQADATLIVTAWQGSARCDTGEIYLTEPDAKVVAPYTLPTKRSVIIGSTLIFDHLPASRETIVLGPYNDDTEISFSFRFYGDCNVNFSQNAGTHVRVVANANKDKYLLEIEDNKDKDFNDLYLEVIVKEISTENRLEGEVTATKAWNNPPNYLYPWCGDQTAPVTAGPEAYHHQVRAFDLGIKKGENICASEKGIVLWVEDSFGSGGCNKLLLPKVNVVVIQTEEGVNQNYLHLDKDSATAAGISPGQVVEQGQVIGKVGNSGYVCSDSGDGSHLHIEWVRNCYDYNDSLEKRKKRPVGRPTLTWSCPSFPADAPFVFR